MVKSLNYPKITVETKTERYEFKANVAEIGSVDGGATHFLNTSVLRDMQEETIVPVPAQRSIRDETPITQSSEQQAGLKAVAQRAKAIERRKLLNARAIEGAILEAQRNLNAVEHEFNMSVLEALHTGLSFDQIVGHLESSKLEGHEDAVARVTEGDTDLLYTLDTAN